MSEQKRQYAKGQMKDYPTGYSNWARLMLGHVFPFYEIAITGPECLRLRQEFQVSYVPNRIFLGTASGSELPLLENKVLEGSSTIFVCENKVCQFPVISVGDALKQMR